MVQPAKILGRLYFSYAVAHPHHIQIKSTNVLSAFGLFIRAKFDRNRNCSYLFLFGDGPAASVNFLFGVGQATAVMEQWQQTSGSSLSGDER
ncbi:hypothetical protein MRB53_013739 [Persea americana]|uniref:Uncharacterized protein n=1 Tax=Persea americana TaxID=3435 RepID=A0ACC2K937_PERAE|nr:hypothetical protein MRB53_013739 [Persea americana]